MQDPFQNLPGELRLTIFESIEDFVTLASFLSASPVATFTFEDLPGDVIQAVTTRLPKELQQIVRAVAIALCDASICSPLVEHEIYINHESFYDPTNEREERIPPVLFSGIPLSALSQFLKLACRIQVFTDAFLHAHIARFNAVKPSHLANPSYMYRSDPLGSSPAGVHYVPVTHESVSWVEEYRVARALWRLQLRSIFEGDYSMKDVVPPALEAQDPEIKCHDPSISNKVLREEQFVEMWPLLTQWELDQVDCVEEFVTTELGISLHNINISVNDTATLKLTQAKLRTYTTSALPAGAPITPLGRFWQQDRLAAKSPQEAYNFFHRYGLRHPRSPLQASKWVHFRRLGFGMWDGERLCKAEFTGLPWGWKEILVENAWWGMEMSLSNCSFTWKSIESEGVRDGEE